MTLSKSLLAAVAALALVACGKKEEGEGAPRSGSSEVAADVGAVSPIERDFKLKDGAPFDVDALFALMPEDTRPTYEKASYDEKLGATVVTNMRFADADDGEGVLVERAEFYGVDMDAIERIRTAEKTGPDAPFETIFQKVRMFDVASEGFESDSDSVELTIAAVELDKLQIRQGGVDGDGVGDEGARFFNAVSLAGLYFQDITLKTTSKDAPGVTFHAPDLRIVGLGGGKLGAVIGKDLEYELSHSETSLAAIEAAMGPEGAMILGGPLRVLLAPENQRTTLKSFEWRKIDLSGLLAWGLKDEKPPMTEKNLIDLGVLNATDMETHVNGKRAAYIEEATVTAADFTWLIPSNVRADTKGALYDLSAYVPDTEEDVMNVVKEYGLDNVKGDGFLAWTWNSDNGDAALEYVANTQGFADFSMGANFSSVKLKDLAKEQENGNANPLSSVGKFNNFRMYLADENALDAIFAIAALEMGGTGEDLRLSAPAMIRLSGMQAAQMNPRFGDYVNAVADFLGKGGALAVDAEPAKPVAFKDLQTALDTAPQTVPDLVDLKVTHKE